MSLQLVFDGDPGVIFERVIRSLPDGSDWLVSDITGAVVIARSERETVREAILSADDDGIYGVECLASASVDESRIEGLVILALAGCVLSILGSWWFGPGGLMGLVVGVVLAGTVPSMVLAIGQRLLDPGRDETAEAQLQRALVFAIALHPEVSRVDSDR